MARLRDWLGMSLIRWGLALISDRRALWLFDEMLAYWAGPRGQRLYREIAE